MKVANQKLGSVLKKLKLSQPQDLLTYYPKKYLDFSKTSLIKDLAAGQTVTVKVKILQISSRFSFKSRKTIVEAVAADATGSLKITWFNQGYIAKQLKAGQEYFFAGKLEYYSGLGFINPIHETAGKEHLHTGRLVPVYSLPEGVYQKTFRTAIKQILPKASTLPDMLPASILKTFNILPLTETVKQLHFPQNETLLKLAQHRLIFEEVFIMQLAAELHTQKLGNKPTAIINPDIDYLKHLVQSLPFSLTLPQKKSAWEIIQDMQKPKPMNRLLQGDVGSGKTAVAFLAALCAVNNGYQVAILAPTEILAQQHYRSLRQFLSHIGQPAKFLHTALLTAATHIIDKEKTAKPALIKKIGEGKIHITIGTHALLQKPLSFKQLGLLIVDEQHRFGVAQRHWLKNPNETDRKIKIYPHLLTLSATPIPRSLALSLIGSLSVSQLTALPLGRQEIVTRVVSEANRGKAYQFIKEHLKTGRQAFIVTPLIEESETMEVKSVKAEYERLQKQIFPEFSLGLLYGSMKAADKNAIMKDFAEHKTQILVSTSVVEVGIDIPNATIMLIEGAERFGLAQLHQLRGRVGRGNHKSFCMLFTSTPNQDTGRLEVFANTQDGFKLAELDLKQRGFGSLFGQEQSGFSFKYSQFLSLSILKTGRQAARMLLEANPKLTGLTELKKQVFPHMQNINLE